MHPLFLAHLVADFLLQPNWLVQWKEKHVFGVIVHAAAHAAVMVLFLLPFRPEVFVMILIIALLHGLIDQAKITYQKKHRSEVASLRLGLFEKTLALDQFAHLLVLIVAVFVMRSPIHSWWASEAGRGVAVLLFFFSFAFALAHLFKLKKFPLKNARARAARFLLISGIFAAYLIPGTLLGISFCSLL